MDNKKFEKLIEYVINENEDKANELFHEIVVEKSREIFESIMAEEELEENMGGQVGDLLDEINAEETGVAEDEDMELEFSSDEDGLGDEAGLEVTDITDDGMTDEFGDAEDDAVEDIQDTVIRVESKIDELMREFETIMSGEVSGDEEEEVDIDVDSDSDDGEEEIDIESDEDGDDDITVDDEETLAEAVQLQKVSVTHGDDGANKKSPVAANSGKTGMDSKPVKFSGEGAEKGRTAPTTKDVPGANKFKNAPGQKKQDLEKTPAPVKKDEASGTKSPVAK